MLIRAFALILLCFLGVPSVFAELSPAELLQKEGRDALEANNPKLAAEKFEAIFAKYPTFTGADESRLLLGISYLLDNQFPKSIENLAKILNPPASESVRERALFFTAVTQIQMAYAAKSDDPKRKSLFETAIATFAKHLKDFTGKSDNTEQAYYNRALAGYTIDDYDNAQKDAETLLAQFPNSLDKVYYLSLLGSIHSSRTVKLMIDKKSDEEIQASAQKAFTAFKQIGTDPNSLVASNEAEFQSAQLRLRLAVTSDSQRESLIKEALANFRQVRSREELIPLLDKRITELQNEVRDAAQKNDNSRRERATAQRDRERGRLERLKQGTDPAVTAALGEAQCFSRLKRYDEARLLLRRVLKYADDASKKSASFELILTFAFQGLADKTNQALDDYQKNYAQDQGAASISVIVGNELRNRGNYAEALAQYERNLRDFPNSEYAEQATLGKASTLVALKKYEDAVGTLEKFTKEKPTSAFYPGAMLDLAVAYENLNKPNEALNTYRALSAAPKASPEQQAKAAYQGAEILFNAKRFDEAAKEYQSMAAKFPTSEVAPFALLRVGNAFQAGNKLDDALKAYSATLEKFGEHPRVGPGAQSYIGAVYQAQSKFPEMVAAYEKLIQKYPQSDQLPIAHARLASYYERNRKIEDAAKHYETLASLPNFPQAAASRLAMSKLYFDKAQSLGAYTALKDDEKTEWKSAIGKSSDNAVRVLQDFPSSPDSNGAIQRLIDLTLNKQKAGLITDAPEKAFMASVDSLSDPTLKARLQLASAAFPYDKGDKAGALAIIKGVLSSNPTVPLTPEDYNRYGLSLLEAKDYDMVLSAAGKLASTYPNIPQAQANAVYLQGAAWQAKGDIAQADTFYTKLEKDFPWSDRIFEAKLGRGKAAAGRNATDEALKLFREVIMSPRSTGSQKASSLVASGQVLEKANQLLPEKGPDGKPLDKPNAMAFYSKAHEFYGEASPEIGSEALLSVARVYEKAGKTADARKNYLALTTTKVYAGSPAVATAQEKLKSLPAQ